MSKFKEYEKLDLPNIHKEVLEDWKTSGVFKKSITAKKNQSNIYLL